MERQTKEVIFEVEAGIGMLTLNRPDKRNALSTSMYEDLRSILERAKRDDEVKVVIVTGAGKGFCAGSDVETRMLPRMAGDHTVPLEKTRSELLEPMMLYVVPAFYNLGKPIIAAINGVAAGAGLSIALMCDIRIASDQARFGASWLNVALVPDCGATFFLPRIVGVDKALKFFLTGAIVDARQAEKMNMVTEVVPHDILGSTAKDLAQKIVSGPSVAIELTRRATYRSLTNDLVSQLYFENYAQDVCFMTEDFREGVHAFQEKRPSKFKGR